jgi:hypothetical protein
LIVKAKKNNAVSRSLLWLTLGLIAALTGCRKFSEGECVQNVRDGYIWRITEVSFYNKYTVQSWTNGKWGTPVEGSNLNLDSGYVKVPCPFSTQMGP